MRLSDAASRNVASIALAALLCSGAASEAPVGAPAVSYLISTYAGGLPDATAASAATYPLAAVNGVAVDPAGNVFLSDPSSVFKVDPAGNLIRVAGTGRAGYSGDGGPALAAQLNHPSGLALDLAGNLYVADSWNHRVRRVSPDGVITTVAGTGTAGDSGDNGLAPNAQLRGPQGVAVDTAGNLYIADSGNHRVRKVSAGSITTVAGTGIAGDSGEQLNIPRSVAVDIAGNLYIADSGNDRIRMVSTGGTIRAIAAGTPLTNPGSVAVDSAGILYIADTGAHRILQVSGGTVESVAGGDAAAVDSAGNLYIADSRDHRVYKVTAAGRAISTVASRGSGKFARSHRMAVATDRNGSVYFTDSDNHRVRRVAPDGTVTTVAGNGAAGFGGDAGPATAAQLDAPAGLATDPAGNLYVADAGSCRVRRVDPSGIITTFAGTGSCSAAGDGGPAANAGLDPHGLAFDSGGNLYIADRRNNRVRKVSAGGVITSVATTLANPTAAAVDSAGNVYIVDTSNSAVRELATDGAMRTIVGASANLGAPEGLAVDADGNVFIADARNGTIRKVAPDGAIETIAGTGVAGYAGDGGPAADAQLSGPSDIALDARGNLYVADRLNSAVRILQPEGSRPLLTVASTHAGNFAAGQAGTFTLTVRDAALSAPTNGIVTVAETLPAGLTLVSMAGAGWTCADAVCQRADRLSTGTSYPPIVVTVSVTAAAAPQVTNVVDVSGGGSVDASAMDTVDVGGTHVLAVVKTHAGNLAQGQTGAVYSITVTNRGTAVTVGTVAVTDALPAGLTATAMSGTGWTCTPATLTCTRSDPLHSGDRYPLVRVTVNVASDAPASVTNVAAVWGGGAATASVGNPAAVAPVSTRGPAAAGKTTLRPADSVPLVITTADVPTAAQYQSYTTTLTATGGTPPYFWSVDPSTGVSLPEGMSLDPSTGIVSATQVNGQGGYQINALVTDSNLPAPNVASALLNFGVNSDDSYGGCPMFPPDSIYNQRIDRLPVDKVDSHQIPSAYFPAPFHPDFGRGFYPIPGGVSFMRVPANQPAANVILEGDGQIDSAGTYAWPFPPWPDALVEGTSFGQFGDDHHILIIQTGNNSIYAPQTGPCTLFETYHYIAVPDMYDAGSNTWSLGAGVHYHLSSDEIARSINDLDHGAQDSTGIPIVPLLIRYSEVPLGAHHPLRITFPSPTDWFVWPATGCCSGSGPPQGLLYRLKASVNWQAVCPVSSYPQAATVLQALQQYGAYMSDHGTPGFIQGVPDVRWDDDDLACIKQFHISDLEVVDNSALESDDPTSGQTVPYVVPAALPDGVVGTAYSAAIAVVGGNPATLQWSVTSGALPPGLALDPVTGIISGTPGTAAGSPFSFAVTVTDTGAGNASQAQSFSFAVTPAAAPAPDLTVVSTHTGTFTEGQTGAMYSLTVTNTGSQPTSDTVTLTDSLPSGLSATAIGGSGWNCTLGTLTCTRGDVLPAGGSYSAVTVTVTVPANAAATLTNVASVSGGGETNTANDQANDPTTVIQLPDFVVTSTHTGNFNLGQIAATYSLVVTNVGGGLGSGTVTLTDSLPAGLTATAVSGQGWTCTPGPPTCTRSDPLTTGGPYQAVTVTVTVAANAPASVINTATVSGGGEINTANDQATDPTTIAQTAVPDVTVSSAHIGNFIQGQIGATYNIAVLNVGGAPTSGAVTLTDTLPSGLTATAIGGTGWSCTLATLICTRGDALASGSNYPLTVTVNVAGNAAANVTNTAAVSGGGETNTTNDSANDPTTILQPPDLTVTSGHSGNFTQGQTSATYSIAVSNIGTGPTLGSVIVIDSLPTALNATAIGGAGWNCTLATLTCTRGDVLSPGGSYPLTVTVTVAPNAPANVTNSVTVAGGSELNLSNNQATDPTTVVQVTPVPNLAVSSSHTSNFTQGQTGATYTLTVSNGASAAPTSGMVKVIDTLPAGLTATAIGGTGWDCTLATLTCMRSDGLNAGASYDAITVTVNVASNAAASVTNQVSVSGGGSVAANASDPTTIILLPILSVASTHTGSFTQGQTGDTYSVTVSNSASAGSTNGTVTVIDTLPTGLAATAIGGTNWNCTLATLTCTQSEVLNAGASYLPIIVTANVASNASASVTNQVSVSGGGSAATANGIDPTTIIQLPALTAVETDDSDTVAAGSAIGFTATVTNSAAPQTGTATAVTLSDSLSARSGMVWSINPPYNGPGTCTVSGQAGGQTLSCNFGDIAAGAMASVHVASSTSPPDCAAYSNTATISASNSGSLRAGPATVTVQCPALLVSAPLAMLPGTAGVSYTASVAASGGTGIYGWAASGLPAGLTIGPTTGIIAGTPAAIGGPVDVQVAVTDSNSTSASRNYWLLIASPCDVNQDGTTDVSDAQTTIDEALGLAPPFNAPLHDGAVNVADVQLVINAVLTMGCPVGVN